MSNKNKFGFDSAPLTASSLADIKAICKAYGIKNSSDYKKRYKEIPRLPAHPERVFSAEWNSYTEFFDIPELKPYRELKKEVQPPA